MMPTLADLAHLARQLDLRPDLQPCNAVADFIHWGAGSTCGILDFVVDQYAAHVHHGRDALSLFDRDARPRVSCQAAFAMMAATYDHQYQPNQQTLALLTTHFNQQGLHISPDQVLILDGGTRAVADLLLGSVLTPTYADNYFVVEPGFERPWQHLAGLGRGSLSVVKELDAERMVSDWLGYSSTRPYDVIVFYIPLVNPLTGRVLTRQRARNIARAVLRYNRDRKHSHAFVLADDSDIDSYWHADLADEIQPIGSITGGDLGDASLGPMSDWTLTIATPGLSFGLTQRPATFAATTNEQLLAGLRRLGNARCHPQTAAIATTALCLTPMQWIDHHNHNAAINLNALRDAVIAVNAELGFEAILVDKNTAAGRHTAVRLNPLLFPIPGLQAVNHLVKVAQAQSENSITAQAIRDLLRWSTYDHEDPDLGLTLRFDLAGGGNEFTRQIMALRDFASAQHQRIVQFGVATGS